MEKKEIAVEELLKRTGTKYHLINLAGKRARSLLMEGDANLKSSEAIDKSLQEITQDKVRIKSGVKEVEGEGKQGEPEKAEGKVRKISRRKKSR